jgi:predicted ATPase with chaperone activity
MAFADAQEGTVTLVEDGALFLDKLPEFDRATLEALRHTARLLDPSAQRISRAAMRSAASGGRTLERVPEEDF